MKLLLKLLSASVRRSPDRHPCVRQRTSRKRLEPAPEAVAAVIPAPQRGLSLRGEVTLSTATTGATVYYISTERTFCDSSFGVAASSSAQL